MVLQVYAILMVVLWVGMCFYLLIVSRRIAYLKSIPALTEKDVPSVAVIIAVKDEEAEVETALQTVCNLDYPALKIVVINDRSTDNTPQILDRMARNNPRIQVITVESLPAGWLGKNHALYQGYRATTSDWMLFADADVLFAPDALRKAMHYVQDNKLDHLTALPEITSKSPLFKSVMTTFALMLNVKLRPWDIANPKSKASMGVGAFNLVKRSAYEGAGTHKVISLRPDDDLKLGERIKGAGFRQNIVFGDGEISLQWYTSLQEFVAGLMKNTFSVANYNIFMAMGMALSTLLLVVLPWPLLIFMGYPYYFAAAIILLSQLSIMLMVKGIRAVWWHALMIPFSGLVMVYIILVSSFRTLRQGGIYWRNSFYSLAELKKQA
ncbi:glycosyltransferase family 2 protein [Flavisolibacter sp. BT320]|nr:glycosyltransferase family 2 protein [Flavisolibacter longurius]